MLKLKSLVKKYKVADNVQVALDNVNLSLRDSEFVAILGPSGSGKTTLLNLIGGLDRYDEGDIIINGISTKHYNDRDWDSYRNHKIGFVFQNYNLIAHQSVLSNVELALTLSGVSKAERRKRAKEALIQVGLKEHIYKKPNQISGGQMQRVAIARALVNNPDILLADEPTGALDSETSIQVMEILKKLSENRLVVMVTHNPELASSYATRIVYLKDGHITEDSDPYEVDNLGVEQNKKVNMGRSSMALPTALALSFNNLCTKKGRTFLTALAGSIGIIGIALILSLSTGVNRYIDQIQKSTMSSYPITIEEQAYDLSSFMKVRRENTDHTKDGVYANSSDLSLAMTMASSATENNLIAFKEYLDDPNSEISSYIGENGVSYSYDVRYDILSYDSEGTLVNASSSKSMMPNISNGLFTELLAGKDGNLVSSVVIENYDMLYGRWPEKENEIVLIVDSNNEIASTNLYQVGLLPQSEYLSVMSSLMRGKTVSIEEHSWTYEDIISHEFYLLGESERYVQNSDGLFTRIEDKNLEESGLLDKAIMLKIVGIIREKEGAIYSGVSGVFAYTNALTQSIISRMLESSVIIEQLSKSNLSVLDGRQLSAKEFETVLQVLGYLDPERPSSINIYTDSFEDKEEVTKCIENYNLHASEKDKITYTDYVALLMNSVTSIVNVISYVLIAFVAVSLVVSSIMIGIITYISVLERTKEIGILRALGASKSNISRVFNAETFIIGLVSGGLGILLTVFLLVPINMIIHKLVGSSTVNAILPISSALVLIALSVILTLIGGFIPARKAAKKDPVAALRTE